MRKTTRRLLPLIQEGRRAGMLTLTYMQDDETCSLTASASVLNTTTYSDDDYFRAFGDLRRDLARLGLYPAVYGAHIDLYPGGLASESSDGLLAYHLADIGESVLVGIFDELPSNEYGNLATIEEQKVRRKQAIDRRRTQA